MRSIDYIIIIVLCIVYLLICKDMGKVSEGEITIKEYTVSITIVSVLIGICIGMNLMI